MNDIQLILLAAGGSTRMGSPKQLLPWGNELLIEHQVKKLLKTGYPVNIVLGAGANEVIPVVKKYDVNICVNDDWEKGMASSIVHGINNIMDRYPATEAVLIALLDQPMLTTEHFIKLMNAFHKGNDEIIVSTANSGWEGVPVIFDKHYFDELQNLKEKGGAKKIIHAHRNKVKRIVCSDSLEDMDTPEAYEKLYEKYRSGNNLALSKK